MKSRWLERTDWTYIVMDVNWLKQTNDQYGHRAGDELLCCAARCIREAFYRAEDCFRIGGSGSMKRKLSRSRIRSFADAFRERIFRGIPTER